MADSKYETVGLNLTNNQKKKIIKAAKDGTDIYIQLGKPNFRGNDMLNLTQNQIKKINNGVGFRLHLTKSQLKSMRTKINKEEKKGGMLPLLSLLPLIFSGLTAAGTVAGTVANAVSKAKADEKTIAEQIRHNKAVESELAKSGNGIMPMLKNAGLNSKDISKLNKGGCVECGGICFQKLGNGLFLGPPQTGNGLFLGPYRP